MALPTFFTKLFSSYGNAPRIKESVTLPAQASQNGKFLKTDGTNTAWDSIPEYADATTSAHGLMSASDKTKIDGVESGAQVNYTWTKGSEVSVTVVKNSPVTQSFSGFTVGKLSAISQFSASSYITTPKFLSGGIPVTAYTKNMTSSIAENFDSGTVFFIPTSTTVSLTFCSSSDTSRTALVYPIY